MNSEQDPNQQDPNHIYIPNSNSIPNSEPNSNTYPKPTQTLISNSSLIPNITLSQTRNQTHLNLNLLI